MAYVPRTPPQPPADARQFPDWFTRQFLPWFADETRAIAAAQVSVDRQDWVTVYAVPDKYAEGTTVKADGTTWNPGSGAGLYQRRSGAWVKLG